MPGHLFEMPWHIVQREPIRNPDGSIDLADVVNDATGNPDSMARALSRARFGGRIVWVGVQTSLTAAAWYRSSAPRCTTRMRPR